jgi:predicted HicB family RNase H-like nuclease
VLGGEPLFDINKPETVNKTFRMPVDLVEKLSKVAQEKKVSLNYLIIQCCEYALKNLPDENITNEK